MDIIVIINNRIFLVESWNSQQDKHGSAKRQLAKQETAFDRVAEQKRTKKDIIFIIITKKRKTEANLGVYRWEKIWMFVFVRIWFTDHQYCNVRCSILFDHFYVLFCKLTNSKQGNKLKKKVKVCWSTRKIVSEP